jgi:hypothetical protein
MLVKQDVVKEVGSKKLREEIRSEEINHKEHKEHKEHGEQII